MARRDSSSTVPLTALQESWFAEDLQPEAAPRSTEPGAVQLRERAFHRLLRAFLGARVLVAVALLAAEFVTRELAGAGRLGAVSLAICSTYLFLALAAWWLPHFNQPSRWHTMAWSQWSMTIGIDLAAFYGLHLLAPALGVNHVPLFALPVLMAAVLSPGIGAMGVAAIVTLMLLGQALYGVLVAGQGVVAVTQAALMGGGFFVVAFLVSQLARRLAREENLARGSQALARQQALVSRIVIEAMDDGVIVVNRRLKVRAANPAARRLLDASPHGDKPLSHLRQRTAWAPLAYIAEMAFEHPGADAERQRQEISLALGPGDLRRLLVRTRLTPPRGPDAEAEDEVLCVIFLADLEDVESRIRQEKLAAMGRISAGVAHEIRNPLSAIAQANALLAEDATGVTAKRLTRMVADNVERLTRIVQDVMAVAPTQADTEAVSVEATMLIREMAGEWAATTGVALFPPGPLAIEIAPDTPPIRFDADHLRRILVNLLDNARRYCSGRPGSIRLRVGPVDLQHVEIAVANDGAPVDPEIRQHLFEPFFSTRSRGTGLGLYICRELCERYDARIDYRLLDEAVLHRNEFIVLARRWHGTLPKVDIELDPAAPPPT